MKLGKITIATASTEDMARFYRGVLFADLTPVPVGEHTMYGGSLGGIQLLLCPKELAGISTVGSTIQLGFEVPDIDAVFSRAEAAGGAILEPIQTRGEARFGALRDPDGHSIEIVQR